jgi:hypothetical protein
VFAVVIASFDDRPGPNAVASALVVGALLLAMSALEVHLVDRVRAAHRDLLASRPGADRPSYP